MKRYGELYPQIYSLENLDRAYRICRQGKGSKEEVLEFKFNRSKELLHLQRALEDGTYRIPSYRSFFIFEPKKRLIQALPFRDRIVQQALCQVIGPGLDRTMIYDSYACRIGKGTHAASTRLIAFLKRAKNRWAKPYCLKFDIADYFNSINHGILLGLFRRKIVCRRTLALIDHITNSNGSEAGLPLGNLLSQLSANLYLTELDRYLKYERKARFYLRYMDDGVVLHGNKDFLQSLKAEITKFLEKKLKLRLNSKTDIFPVSQGIDFVGYRTWATHKLLRKSSKKRMRRKLKVLVQLYEKGQTGKEAIIQSVNSWMGHAKWADTFTLRRLIHNSVPCELQRHIVLGGSYHD